jgi:hypothetical protein
MICVPAYPSGVWRGRSPTPSGGVWRGCSSTHPSGRSFKQTRPVGAIDPESTERTDYSFTFTFVIAKDCEFVLQSLPCVYGPSNPTSLQWEYLEPKESYCLGAGAFGRVYVGRLKLSGEQVSGVCLHGSAARFFSLPARMVLGGSICSCSEMICTYLMRYS